MRRWIGVAGAGLLTVIACAGAWAADGTWVRKAPIPEGMEELVGAAAGGTMYVMEGFLHDALWKPAGVVYAYDPATDAWAKRKPMAHPAHHAAIAELNGKLYIFGGFVLPAAGPPAWVPLNAAGESAPATDGWRALAPMPTRRGAAPAAAAGGKLYVIGGAAQALGDTSPSIHPARPHRSLDTVEEYDPATNSWRTRTPMPTPRNHMASGSVNGKIYVIGGRLGGAFIVGMPGNTDVVQEYDPATDRWATKAPMPTARSALSAAVLNGRIYTGGGEVQTYQYLAAFRAFEAYDPASNRWETLPFMPQPRHGFAMAAVGGGIHCVSGDIQSAIAPPPRGVNVHTDTHDVFLPR